MSAKDLDREIEELRGRVRELEKAETARREAEAELLETNMRLSKALTELKRRQQQLIQQARMNALGQMTSGIAHDFSNALMPIQGFSEFLLNNPAATQNKEELRSILQDIHDASRHATDLVRRLSSFYRPSDETEHSLVAIEDVVDAAVTLTKPRWKGEMASKGIRIEICKEIAPLPKVACSETQIREMITNMILNAIDALPRGGIITIRASAEKNKWIVFQVCDNGIGMSLEVAERCFEPFYTTKGRNGTGIGLAMVYGIVRGHGGQVTVESEENKGSTFTVRLPIETTLPKRAKPAPKTDVVTRPLHVLIIDDELWSRNLMVRFFEQQNHSTVVATTGRDGLHAFQKHKFDLVVTDRAMPDINGDTVAAELKKLAPHIPIIMVTGFGEIMKATGEMPDGIDQILSKPLTRSELAEAVAKVIR